MGDEFSNTRIEINLDLTKPVTILVQKVCGAIGMVYEPHHIRRIANAKADAQQIEALSRVKTADISQRAIQRFVVEETKKQINIDSILAKALPDVHDDSKPQDIENDWIVNFFDKCRLISDDQMQSLWAKVLAGQANSPGRFSKRTVNFLITLDKSDADSFATLCRFIWDFGDDRDVFMFGTGHPDLGLNSAVLKHLDQIGLIAYYPQGYNPKRIDAPIQCAYFGRKIFVKPKVSTQRTADNVLIKSPASLLLGNVNLTKIGHELAPLCEAKPVDGIFDQVAQSWARFLDVEKSPD